MLGGDADARVADVDGQLRTVGGFFKPCGHFDSALFRELDRVADEVHQELPEPRRVGDDGFGDAAVPLARDIDSLLLRRALKIETASAMMLCGAAHGIEIDLARLDLRQVENVVDHTQQVTSAAMDRVDVVVALFSARLRSKFSQHVGKAENAVERRADLVAHVGQECALGLIGGLGRILGLFQAPRPPAGAR